MSRVSRVTLAAALAVAALPIGGPVAAAISVAPLKPLADVGFQPVPLPTSACVAQFQTHCYSPNQLRSAYDLDPLHSKGITGKGRTIVLLEAFGSPTVQHDLDVFDKQFGLPDTQVEVFKWGTVPPFDPTNDDQVGWAEETSLDVQAAHTVAPGAKIVVAETAVDQTNDGVGVPEMMSALNHLVNQGGVDTVSMSWGAREAHFPGYDLGDYTALTSLRYAFQNAVQHGATLAASSGDGGGIPNVGGFWPASDPLVTAVGGTHLNLDDAGKRQTVDSAWIGSGGYRSTVFPRPAYQNGVKSVVGATRGTPDISLDADPDGGLWIYTSFAPAQTGWWPGGGTSQSAPMFAALVTLADQAAGHRFGLIDNDLYRLYAEHARGLVDITVGNTADPAATPESTGFDAVPGYDQATGVGTVDAAKFVADLVRPH